MSERRTPTSHSKIFGASPTLTFSTPSEIFKRFSSPTLISSTPKNSTPETHSLYNSNSSTISRLESPTKSPSLIRYQPRFESPSERDGLKSPSTPRDTPVTNDKSIKENFVLLDQDDFSKGIDVIRTKIDTIEDEMKTMQSQYSRFQEKDSFLNSIEFSSTSDKNRWKSKKRDDFLQSLDNSIKNEKLEEIHHLITVYRTGLKQNVFDFKDQQLRSAVDNATKLFQEKLNFIQSLDGIEKEIQTFLNEVYNNIENHILDSISFGDDKLRIRIESFEKTYTKNLRVFSTHFGKETSTKVNNTQKMIDESIKIVEMVNSFVKSQEKGNQHDLEVFYSQVPTEMVRLLKLTHNCLASFASSIEKKKDLASALVLKDVNLVRQSLGSFSDQIEKIVASDLMKEAQAFLSHFDSDKNVQDEKERRKKEVVQRIKNIIEKSETFSVEKQQKFTQILLESGIRDPAVLRELRMAWETKRNRVFDDKFNREHLLQTFLAKLKDAILSQDVNVLEAAIIVPDGIKSDAEKWKDLRQDAKVLLDSLLSISVEEIDIKSTLETMLNTKNLENFQKIEKEIRNDFKNSEIKEIWNNVCELKKKQEESLPSVDLSLGSDEFNELLLRISPDFDSTFMEQQWVLWEKYNTEKIETQVIEALSEKEERKLKECLDIIDKEERLKLYFISKKDQILSMLNSIQDSRTQIERAIELREITSLENAITKGKRFSHSLADSLIVAEHLISLIEREDELSVQYSRVVKNKDLGQLQDIIDILQNNTDLRIDSLVERAREAEKDIQLFMDLQGKLDERDFPNIAMLLERSNNCKEFTDRVLLDEAKYVLVQNQNSKEKILSQLGNIHNIEMLEESLKMFKEHLSNQDVSELHNQWREFMTSQLTDQFDSILQAGNEFLLRSWNERVNNLNSLNPILLEMQEKSNSILNKIGFVRKCLIDSAYLDNITQTEEAINSVGLFLEKEAKFLKSNLDTVKKRETILRETDQILGSEDATALAIDEIIAKLLELDQNVDTLATIEKLQRRKQSITVEQDLKGQFEAELDLKNSSGRLPSLVIRASNISRLSEVRTVAEQFLLKQNQYREELRQIASNQSVSKIFDESIFQNFYEYLPRQEVDEHSELVNKTIIKFKEQQEKFNELLNANEQSLATEFTVLEQKLSSMEADQRESLASKKIQIENELNNLIEMEKARIEADILLKRETFKSDIEKLIQEEVEEKNKIQKDFLLSKEVILKDAEKEQSLLKQQIDEIEKQAESVLHKNDGLIKVVETLREKISEQENQNEEMKLYIKSLEESYNSKMDLEPKLAEEEHQLTELISKIEERLELQKENICIMKEKIEEQELILQDKILYRSVVEEKLKKKQEEIEKQVEEIKTQSDEKTKSLQSLEEKHRELENAIEIIDEALYNEEEIIADLSSKLEHELQMLEDIKLKRKEQEEDLERSRLCILEQEEEKNNSVNTLKEELAKISKLVTEKLQLEDQLRKSMEMKGEELDNVDARTERLLSVLDERQAMINKHIANIEQLEKSQKEKEEELSRLVHDIEKKQSSVEDLQRNLLDQMLQFDSLVLQEEELSSKLKDQEKKKESKEEEERKLKDQLISLEENIRQIEKNNSEKAGIVEQLKDDSKLKTLEKLEMLKNLEEEEKRMLEESICREESLLNSLKENNNKKKIIADGLVNEKKILMNQQQENLEKIKMSEDEIAKIQCEISELEPANTEKQNYLLELQSTLNSTQDNINKIKCEIDEKTKNVIELEHDVHKHSEQLKTLREQEELVQTQLKELKEICEKETKELDMVIVEKNDLNESMNEIRNHIVKQHSEKEILQTDLEHLNNSQAKLREEIFKLREDLDNQNIEKGKLKEEKSNLLTQLENELSAKGEQLDNLNKQASDTQTQVNLLMENLENQTKELDIIAIEKKDIEETLNRIKEHIMKQQSEKEILQKDLEDLNNSQTKLIEDVGVLKQTLGHQNIEKDKLNVEKSNLEAKMRELNATRDNIEEETKQIIQIENELSENESHLKDLNEQKLSVQTRVTLLHSEKESLKKSLDDLSSSEITLQEEILKLKEDLSNQSTEKDKLKVEKSNLEAKMRELNETIIMIEEETKLISTELFEDEGRLRTLNEQKLSVQSQLNLMKEDLEKETKELDIIEIEKKDIEETMNQIKGNIMKQENEILQKNLEDLINSQTKQFFEKESLQKSLDDLSSSEITLQEEILKLKEDLSNQSTEQDKLKVEKSNLEVKLKELNENSEKEIISLQTNIKHLQTAEEEKTGKLKSLETELADLESALISITEQQTGLEEKQKQFEANLREKEDIVKKLENTILELNSKVTEQEIKEAQFVEEIKAISKSTKQEEENRDISAPVEEQEEKEENVEQEKKEEDGSKAVEESKEKKKAILPSKANKIPTPMPIETLDNSLSQLYKRVSKGELKMDEENKVFLNYDDSQLIEIARQYSIILSDQCNIGHNTPTFLYNILMPKFVDSIMSSIKKETDTSSQNKLKKVLKKLRGFKKSFAEFKFPKDVDKEYFTLSVLYVYYLNANGVFNKDFWDILLTSTDFLKEFFGPTSILYNPSTKDDLLFLTKKQSKFKIKNMDLFETSEEAQKTLSDYLLIDFPNAPPIESLKSVLAEIKCSTNLREEIKKIVKRKLSRSLLSVLEVGFRTFKFFGRYYFWDFIKFYVEKAEKTQGEIKDAYQNINDLASGAKIKLTEPNDVKFVLFVVNAFNKRKLAEWFKKLASLPQIGDYFTEESIIRSDKMSEIVRILEDLEMNSKSFMVDLECSEDMLFNYEKCAWNE